MPNRLAGATSPYLLQHAENPVDWWPWEPAAFRRAVRSDRPILLSVGYAACHWCHVMAHESFEDEATARLINERFVAIKVDREERPDVDAVYMAATQALTGQGGWPMTVFLTPDRKPFYAGTYFPPRPTHGLPSFTQVLEAVSEAWTDRRDEVVSSVANIQSELAARQPDLPGHRLTDQDLDTAVQRLRTEFDAEHGGFGGAPKFPPSMVLEGLLRLGESEMTDRTLEAMARGGIYDQLAGGFARYSVDSGWVVPHFEKMLYDNALLLGVYAHWWRRTRNPLAARVVEETADWLDREMLTDSGGYAASLDADSLDAEGELREGAYYVWTHQELGDSLFWLAERETVASMFGVTVEGTFEGGRSVLQLPSDPDEHRWADAREALRRVRDGRPRPGRDDKVVAAWNGWLSDPLVQAAAVFDRADWLRRAESTANYLWRVHVSEGQVRRTSRHGYPGDAPGILEDYAALALAATRLGAARSSELWIWRAQQLVETIITEFDDGRGGFYDTAADAEPLYTRPRELTDNATPSGLSTTVLALRLLAEVTGRSEFAERAEHAAATAGALVATAPRFAGWLMADGVTRLRRPPVEVAVIGLPEDPATSALALTAHRLAPAGSVVMSWVPFSRLELLDRPMVDGRPTAYVCRDFVCKLPVTDVEGLTAQLVDGGRTEGMRRIAFTETGSSDVLSLIEEPIPSPGPGEVLVRLHRGGVNPTDWKARAGSGMPLAPGVVQTPGHDGSGVVEAAGAGVGDALVGLRVWVWGAAAGRPYGTAGEYTVVPAHQALTLPDSADDDLGASLGVPFVTAHRCLTVLEDGPRQLGPGTLAGRTVLVAGGAGAVGNAAIQLARWSDAMIISTVSSPAKAQLAAAAGSDHVIDYRTQDVAAEVAKIQPGGVDVIVDVDLAHNAGIDAAVLARNGVVACYGGDPDSSATLPVRTLMMINGRVQFVLLYTMPYGATQRAVIDIGAALVDRSVGAGEEHGLPVHHFPLEDTAAAHDAVQGGAVGKVLIDLSA